MEEERSKTREQRCWVHKTANVLDKLPRSVQPYAKKLIHEMYLSPKKEKALAAYRRFLSEFEAKYPKATDCLRKDEDVLFTFYDFPDDGLQAGPAGGTALEEAGTALSCSLM